MRIGLGSVLLAVACVQAREVGPAAPARAGDCAAIYTAINAAWVRRPGATLVLYQDTYRMNPARTTEYRRWLSTQMDSLQAETIESFISRNRTSTEICGGRERPDDVAVVAASSLASDVAPTLQERVPNGQGPVSAMAIGVSPDKQQALVVVAHEAQWMAVRLARNDNGTWRSAEAKVLFKSYR